jgi:hypothetical protein
VQRLRRLRASPCRAAFLDFRPSIANLRVVQLSTLRFRPVGQLDRLSGVWRIAATSAIHSGGVGHGGQSGTSVGTNCSRRGFASSFRWFRMESGSLNWFTLGHSTALKVCDSRERDSGAGWDETQSSKGLRPTKASQPSCPLSTRTSSRTPATATVRANCQKGRTVNVLYVTIYSCCCQYNLLDGDICVYAATRRLLFTW